MRYAEVSVNSPAAQRRTFSYSIPPELEVEPGQAVWVPFGEKLLQGVVFELTDFPAVEKTRDIVGIIETESVLPPESLVLARWISDYYLAPLFDAVALMLSPGFDRKAVTFIKARQTDTRQSSYTDDESAFLKLIGKHEPVPVTDIEKQLGQKKTRRLVTWAVHSGLAERHYELEPLKAKPKIENRIRLVPDTAQTQTIVNELRQNSRNENQVAILEYLMTQNEPVSIPDIMGAASVSRYTVHTLLKKGLVTTEQIAVRRDPLASNPVNISYPLTLTSAQQKVFDLISGSLNDLNRKRSQTYLLHGVTGSGKTEIYLHALAETVKLGKRSIMLVPEIALTPQTIERFASRFPGRVAVLHSQLSMGERYDEWQRIRKGEVDVVIGPRSAVFAPQPDLGLIVLDEEHEWTYKQQDNPRYHTRDVALKLAELNKAVVILGSATPDVETFYHAESGDFQLLDLPERVTPYENAPLPQVEVVDLRDELKAGNRSMFSRSLSSAVNTALAGNEQVMLFLNRRGAATHIQCRDCGFVLRCRRCDIPLTYHLDEELLVCHQCNNRTPVPAVCPQCGSRRIKFLGTGTQKLEQEAREAFPGARLLRWDADTTGKRNSHYDILRKFRDHEADILIGTQMITKGLDLPLVTLVGVVSADTSLNLPDFRSGERTFQILTQVAGRAGRGPLGGKVIIQTYSPEHYAVRAASRHDYGALYKREIAYRKELHYPPFTRLVSLTYSHINDDFCRKEAERMKAEIMSQINTRGLSGISIIGPAPAFIHRLRGRYRWQIVLRGSGLSAFLTDIPIPQKWVVDIDPVGL